jgi:hypothetical protein
MESQSLDLFPIQLKHKILGEAIAVSLHGSIQL